uniref:Zona pellucida sperm-binding protein 4 n=1 Tax=Pygocentrus nattereri TaxID=42514 RepID=A0AAR2KC53_PYGNA
SDKDIFLRLIACVALFVHLNSMGITAVSPWSPQAAKRPVPHFPGPRDPPQEAKWPLPHFPGPRDPPQEAKQPLPHFPGLLDPQQPVVTPHICGVDDVDRVPCGEPGIDAAQCGAINCCFDGQQCYYGRTVTVQCTIDGQFVLVVARDTTLPRLSLDSISLLGGSDAPCSAVDSNADFAIYQFPVTACGTRAMELGGYVVYENKMSSSYEVGVGPLGAITRDSHYELYFQCRYADATVAALAVQLASNNPPMPVAASGPLMVELRLGSGQCVTKGCMQAQAAYTSYYGDADYPVTKVLREPVYVEVRILGRTDPNIALVLGRCWATSSPDPFSIPQWELLVDGCPYQHDSYLTTPIPVDGSSGLQFPSHYKRFVLKMFAFVDHASMAPLQEKVSLFMKTRGLLLSFLFFFQVFIHCSTSVCQLTAADSCEPRCSRQRRDVVAAGRKSSHQLTVVSSGEVIFTEKAETVPPELQGNPNLVE